MKRWLLHVRTSGRVAFLLRLSIMFPSMLLSLWWARTLLHVMGPNNYGLLIAFQGVLSLATLGDLGMGGALVIRGMRLLANNQSADLSRLHATARSLFLGFAVGGLILILCLSPWLPALFRLVGTPASGSLSTLFLVGGLYAFFVFLSAYYQTILYTVRTVSWVVLPPVLLYHFSNAFQLLCASYHAPLWLQLVPSVILGAGCLFLYRQMVRVSHPELAGPLPLAFESRLIGDLFQSSFWFYLLSITTCIFSATDSLMVNAGFGASQVPPYMLNYKLCDLAMTIIIGISFVAVPKIIADFLSPDAGQKKRGAESVEKLRKTQTFLGFGASLFYLAVNDVFVRWWYGSSTAMPLNLQLAFASTLLLMASGTNSLQLWGRLNETSLQRAGVAAIVSAMVNLGLSYAAMSAGWIAGIAWATWIAQALCILLAVRAVCHEFQIPLRACLLNIFLVPPALLLFAFFILKLISPHSISQWFLLIGSYLAILFASFFLFGLRPSLFGEELTALWNLARAPQKK